MYHEQNDKYYVQQHKNQHPNKSYTHQIKYIYIKKHIYILECADEWGKSEVWHFFCCSVCLLLLVVLLLLTTRQTENTYCLLVVVVVDLLGKAKKEKRGLWLSKELIWRIDICYTISQKLFLVESREYLLYYHFLCFLFFFVCLETRSRKSLSPFFTSFLCADIQAVWDRGNESVEKFFMNFSSISNSPVYVCFDCCIYCFGNIPFLFNGCFFVCCCFMYLKHFSDIDLRKFCGSSLHFFFSVCLLIWIKSLKSVSVFTLWTMMEIKRGAIYST